jgi:hypothetical protein
MIGDTKWSREFDYIFCHRKSYEFLGFIYKLQPTLNISVKY